jgi:hypothetical protein
MKRIVKSEMVAHLWANKSQDWAKTPTRNFYFEGNTIYSYGMHFPVARHVKTKRGDAVLMTTRSHSITTNGHINNVSRACCHLTVFHADPKDWNRPAVILESYRIRILETLKKYVKARVYKDHYERIMRELVEDGNALAVFFGLSGRITMPDLDHAKEHVKKLTERESERQRRAYAKHEKELEAARIKAEEEDRKYLAGLSKHLSSWIDGGSRDSGFYRLPCRLRIVGESVETSHGADFPLDHGIKAFRLIRVLHDKGRSWERNGREIRLGMFHLDAVDDKENFKAGCHSVAYAEIERIAKIAGVEGIE